MTASPNIQFFVKINSLGVIFIAIVILFVCGMGFYSFSNTQFTYSRTKFDAYLVEAAIDP
jgi:TctA family transporter